MGNIDGGEDENHSLLGTFYHFISQPERELFFCCDCFERRHFGNGKSFLLWMTPLSRVPSLAEAETTVVVSNSVGVIKTLLDGICPVELAPLFQFLIMPGIIEVEHLGFRRHGLGERNLPSEKMDSRSR